MNKRKLNAVMQLHGESQQNLADFLEMSLSRLNAKINEYRGAQFRQNEIAAIQEHYGLTAEEVNEIFFASLEERMKKPRRGAGGNGEIMKYEEIMADIKDINGPWSNAACMGYCRMAMQNAGVDECTQRKVLRELEACFDQVSVEEAAQVG